MEPVAARFLGSSVCNILGDRAYLFLKKQELIAEIYHDKKAVTSLSSVQIKGGREGNMPLEELIQLVQTVAAPFLFVSYQAEILWIFARSFQELQKNQFLKPLITFPARHFSCIRREAILEEMQKALQNKQIVVLLNAVSVPFKRVGKTEIALHYFEERRKSYTHAFWIQAFDPWYLKQEIEKMAASLNISSHNIREWLSNNTSYLIVFDEVPDSRVIQEYLPSSPTGHIIITSRIPLRDHTVLYQPLLENVPFGRAKALELNRSEATTHDHIGSLPIVQPRELSNYQNGHFQLEAVIEVGLFTLKEGAAFLLSNKQGIEEDAQRITQCLGHVPCSLYRAIETMEAADIALSDYLTYCQTILDNHVELAKTKSNLPPRNRDFVGREPGLVALEESFSRNKPIVLAANAGLGGIGKTQIALQYAYRTCPQYTLIWWINCENMHISYDELAKRLGISLSNEEQKQENALLRKVNRYLESKPGWLLIFDNAEDGKILQGLLPQSGGHILITSRNPNWDDSQVEVFGVKIFEREESVDLILKVTGLYGQENEAGRLAQQLQDLPLAIAQASAYIRQTKISIQEYTDDFEKQHHALWKREKTTNNYVFTVNITWDISMRKIQEIERHDAIVPQPIAMPLMQVCSFFASNSIPREALLLEWLKLEYEKTQKNTEALLADLNRTLELLEKFSMIGVTGAHISLHALVQTVIRDLLSPKTQREVYEQAFKAIIRVMSKFKKDDHATWEHPKLCTPHGMALFNREELTTGIKLPEQFSLAAYLEQIHWIFGNFPQELNFAQRCLVVAEKWCIENPCLDSKVAVSASHNNIGLAYRRLGGLDLALKHLQKALELQREVLGKNNPELGTNYNNIGIAHQSLGRFEEALKYFKKASNLYGANHPELSTSYVNIGEAYRGLGNLKQALEYNQKALVIRRENLGDNHPDVAVVHNNIGAVHQSLQNFAEALKVYEQALRIMLQAFDENNPNVAMCYSNIGLVNQQLENYQEALRLLQLALKINLSAYSENHPVVAKTHHNLSMIYYDLGDSEEAFKHGQMALEINLQALGTNHLDVAKNYSNIGLVYQLQDNIKEALKCYQKALEIYLDLHYENHSDLVLIYINIGQAQAIEGNIKETLTFFHKALKICLNSYDESHHYLALIYRNIGTAYKNDKNFAEALKYYQRLVEISSKTVVEGDLSLGLVYYDMGTMLSELKRYKEALEYFLKALPDSATDQLMAAHIFIHVGSIYSYAGNFQDALRSYQEAFIIFCKTYQQTHEHILNTLKSMIEFSLRVPSDQFNTLKAIYPLCEKTLGEENMMTQILNSLIAGQHKQTSKNSFTLNLPKEFQSSSTEIKAGIELHDGVMFPYLLYSESSLIYDLPAIEERTQLSKKPELFENKSLNRAIYRLFYAGSVSNTDNCIPKDSTWDPTQCITDLLQALKEYGPIIIWGHFGKHCYEEPPIECKPLLSKTIHGWPRGSKRVQNPSASFMIIIGVEKAEPSSDINGFIYFVDPENDLFYKISYQNLTSHIKKSELMNGYAIHPALRG